LSSLQLFVPTSIPSPPASFADIYVSFGWLHSIIPAVSPTYTLDIKTYALCLLTGIIAATVWASIRLTKRGGEPGVGLDFAFGAVILGIIGARTYHVLTHLNDYFGPGKNSWNPFEPGAVWNVWDGGIAIFGSIIGGAIGILIVSHFTGVRFWSFADALVPGLLLAQSLGRFGNYFNHELYGQPTTLPWGLQIESTNPAYPIGLPAHTLFQPTFLYESLWNVLGLVVILLLEKQYRLRWGKLTGLYFMFYGLGRLWFESIRVDPSDVILGLRSNVWGAIIAMIVGFLILVIQTRRHPGVESSVYRPGKEWDPNASKVDSPETYSDSDDGDDAADVDEKQQAPQKQKSPKIAATSGAGV
jgi:prolipoprotein diacylglyceryl transferase